MYVSFVFKKLYFNHGNLRKEICNGYSGDIRPNRNNNNKK